MFDEKSQERGFALPAGAEGISAMSGFKMQGLTIP